MGANELCLSGNVGGEDILKMERADVLQEATDMRGGAADKKKMGRLRGT